MISKNPEIIPAPDNMNYERPWKKFYEKGTPPNLVYPEKTMYQMVEESARRYPDYIAYEFMGTKVTYKKLIEQIDICSKALLEIGVQQGDKVTVCLPNVPHAIIIFYSINKVGAIANMIHPLSAPKEIEYAMTLTESKYIITTNFLYKNVREIKDHISINKIIIARMNDFLSPLMSLGFWIQAGRKIPKINMAEDDRLIYWEDFMEMGEKSDKTVTSTMTVRSAAVLLYSGGTTGTQKGILLSNNNFNALALQTAAHQDEKIDGDKMMCILPLFHGFGLGVCVHTPLCLGGTSILVPKFNADVFAEMFMKHKPQYIAGVPTLYEALMRSEKMKKADFSCLKGAFAGGDALPEEIKKRFDQFMKERGGKITLQEGFGLTETVTASCLMPKSQYKPGSVGIPYPDMLYKIVVPGTETPVPPGENGEICISGPTVMMGYYNEPEETANVLKVHSDGRTWVHTGDMGYMDQDGFVYFKQRIKRIIKSSGYSVFPTQIEEVINKHEAVSMCCVIGVPDEYQIERIKAFVVLKKGYEESEELKESILNLCRSYLAKWSTPREIEFRKELPLTKVGKVAYTVLEKEAREKQANVG